MELADNHRRLAYTTSVSLMDPTDKLAIEIIECAIGTDGITTAHLITNLAASVFPSDVHGS